MINLEALKNAKKTKFYIVKEAPSIKLWKVVPYDESPYYAIIKTINADNSITLIRSKLRMAIKTFNKLKRSKVPQSWRYIISRRNCYEFI